MIPIVGLIPIIGKAIGKALGIVDKFISDKDKATELKAAIESLVLVQGHDELVKELDGQVKIILAEAKGGWLQRNWRPGIMALFALIIANNYVVNPYLSAIFGIDIVMPIPPDMWTLLKLGIGGYIVGRSTEKVVKEWKNRQ